MSEAKKQVLQLCYEDLSYLGKVISPQTYYLPSPEFHKEIDELLLDETIVQCCIEAPRGTAKSSKTISKIIHHSIFDIGDKLVIIQSKTRPEAINRLTKIKNVFEYSHTFRDLFDNEGYATSVNALVWREDKITVKMRCPKDGKVYTVTIKAIGTGMQVRGALEGDTRITLYILDDPDDENSCITKEQMDKNFDKFLGGVAGLDRRNGRVIVIGTPIRMGCIVERLRNGVGWTTKRYQSYWEEDGQIKVLWEEMYNYEWLINKKEELKSIGNLSKFYSEYQCEIVGEEDQLFKPEYVRYWDGTLDGSYLSITHLDGVELPTKKIVPVNVFLGIDPASSTKQTADYSVTMPVAYDGDNLYVLPYFRKRVTPTAHAEQIIETIKLLKPVRAQVETVGYQEMMRQYLRQRLDEEKIWVGGLETKYTPRTEKSARLEALHPLFYNKRVFLKKNMNELFDELLSFPRGRHDDTLDGLYYATRKLIAPDHIVEGSDKDDRHFAFSYFNQKRNNWIRA